MKTSVQNTNQLPTQYSDNDIYLKDICDTLWAKKYLVIIISFLFSIASAGYALSKPDLYQASIILTSSDGKSSADGLSSLAAQFGGLANIAGINIGKNQNSDVELALEIIKSRSFLENFITTHDLIVPLMATKSWDRETNTLIYNDTIYDKKSNKWKDNPDSESSLKPSNWEAYKTLLDMIVINYKKSTSIITIDLEFYSPSLAKVWLQWLIEDINKYMRETDKKETIASIDYLKEQLKHIEISNMTTVFYTLIEEQMKSLMLAQVKTEYVLKTIDPSQVPETKHAPNRLSIVILGTLIGGILAILGILALHFRK